MAGLRRKKDELKVFAGCGCHYVLIKYRSLETKHKNHGTNAFMTCMIVKIILLIQNSSSFSCHFRGTMTKVQQLMIIKGDDKSSDLYLCDYEQVCCSRTEEQCLHPDFDIDITPSPLK